MFFESCAFDTFAPGLLRKCEPGTVPEAKEQTLKPTDFRFFGDSKGRNRSAALRFPRIPTTIASVYLLPVCQMIR